MKLSTKFISPTVIIFALSTALIAMFTGIVVKDLINSQTKKTFDTMINSAEQSAKVARIMVDANIARFADKALEQASLFSTQPEVVNAYQLAHQGNIDNETDPTVQKSRQQLREYMTPIEK